jgi:hypothetical protein
MIEALGNATLTEIGASGQTAVHDLEITGITFQDGDLCRPLYSTLFDYGRTPTDARFEPGVQILRAGHRLRFLFQIEEKARVEFLSDGGLPVVLSITEPYLEGPIPGLTAVLLDPVTCQLTWDQEEADRAHNAVVRVTALRLLCRLLDREPTDPEQVDGGLYLAIVNRPEEEGPDLGIGDRGVPEPRTIKLLGSDGCGRPVYDLFLPGAQTLMPSYLGLEPTIRVREHEKVDLSVQIATLPGIDLRFERAPANPKEVEVHGYEPRGWPSQLRAAERQDFGRRCQMVWIEETGRHACTTGSAEKGMSYCVNGRVATFYLTATLEGGFERIFRKKSELAAWRKRGVRMQFDPTVIQPPSCTASGICI